jgi:tyrosine-protein kinase Etk/Wzc
MLFFFRTIVTWRKSIILSGVTAGIAMLAISFLLPKWYMARTSVFPPESGGSSPMYAELIQNLSLPVLGQLGGAQSPETIYIHMLQSRRVAEQIIDEFHLMDLYEISIIEYCIEEFQSHAGFTLLENGMIVLTFEDKDPKRAAAIANRCVELLDEFNRELTVSRASRTRQFIESHLAVREVQLATAESELRAFQEESQALQLDEQLIVALNLISELTGDAIALETELEILKQYTSTSSQEYKRKEREYREVVNQISKLKTHPDDSDDDLVRSFIPTLEEVPELALQLIRLTRHVEIESAVYTMLLKEFEKTRIEEARDTPTLQVLDVASVPNLRSRPRRKLLALAGVMLGIVWSGLFALFVTAWRENREQSQLVKHIIDPIVTDVTRIFRRNRS